jgi:hypothetical protein
VTIKANADNFPEIAVKTLALAVTLFEIVNMNALAAVGRLWRAGARSSLRWQDLVGGNIG